VAIDRLLIGFAACLLHASCNKVFSRCNLLRASCKTKHEACNRFTVAKRLRQAWQEIARLFSRCFKIACKILHAILKLRQKWLYYTEHFLAAVLPEKLRSILYFIGKRHFLSGTISKRSIFLLLRRLMLLLSANDFEVIHCRRSLASRRSCDLFVAHWPA
jgi:hypothetical protein